MSATADDTNGLVLIGEDFGYNYGIQLLPSFAPPGTRKMRLAYRGWFDNRPDSQYDFVSEDYHSTTAWGLSWINQVPYQKNEDDVNQYPSDPLNSPGWVTEPETFGGFIGPFMTLASNSTGQQTRNVMVWDEVSMNIPNGSGWVEPPRSSADAFSLAPWGQYSGTYYQTGYFLTGKSLTDGGANRHSALHWYITGENDQEAMMCRMPTVGLVGVVPNSAGYENEVTQGWEFSANELDQRMTFRYYWDANSIAEGSLINVFDTGTLQYTSSSFTGDEATQWRPDLTTFNWPTYFVARNGHPTMKMVIKTYEVAYYDINGDPLL